VAPDALSSEPGVRLSLAPGWHDLAVSDLDEAIRESLAQRPWLNSLGFCTVYDHPPAQRAYMRIDEQGRIASAAFYRERQWAGLVKIVACVGFAECSDADILDLTKLRNARLAIVNRMEAPETPARHSRGRLDITHDVIAELPVSKDEYLQSLGRQKRQQLPRYWRRLEREFGRQLQFRVQRREDIRLDVIHQLIRFNQTRMVRLGKENTTKAESKKQERRWPLTLAEGRLCTIEAGDRLLGGTFNYVHGSEAFLIVIAHDPSVERLNIGNLAVWKTAEHLIDSGIQRYHLFWGRKPYKTQFGGRDFPVFQQVISPHPWLVPLWLAHLWFWRHAPRAIRFLQMQLRKLFVRGAQREPGQPDSESVESAGDDLR
jgi:hypothetical protein